MEEGGKKRKEKEIIFYKIFEAKKDSEGFLAYICAEQHISGTMPVTSHFILETKVKLLGRNRWRMRWKGSAENATQISPLRQSKSCLRI